MKIKDYFKIGKKRQSKMPLAIAIGIPLGGTIGIMTCLLLNEDYSLGLTAGGFLGLSIGLMVGAILDVYEKRKQ